MDNFQTPNRVQLNKDVKTSKINKNSSPLCVLPDHTTPPSRFIKIKNPFKAALDDQLHKHVFSPSVFAETQTPKSTEKFKWSIDDLSNLKPANIDVNTVSQFEISCSEDDIEIQDKIKRYFNEQHVVESPMTEVCAPVLVGPSPLAKISEEKESNTVWTQTVLSLPPKLPESLEKALLPFFSFTEDQRRQTVDLNSSLCRRLFHFESKPENSSFSDDSLHSDLSEIGSPFQEAEESEKRKRNYDSSPGSSTELIPQDLSPISSSSPLNNCVISPIRLNLESIVCREGQNGDSLSPLGLRLGGPRLNLSKSSSGHMSVDTSFNLAPENEFVIGNQTNLSESPLLPMESSCNWDMEYNNVSIRTTRRSLFDIRVEREEKMDISNLQTPKSKIITSQRKNLSNSFKFESLSDEEGAQQQRKCFKMGPQPSSGASSPGGPADLFFASTPSKESK